MWKVPDIARHFGVSIPRVYQILTGSSGGHRNSTNSWQKRALNGATSPR